VLQESRWKKSLLPISLPGALVQLYYHHAWPLPWAIFFLPLSHQGFRQEFFFFLLTSVFGSAGIESKIGKWPFCPHVFLLFSWDRIQNKSVLDMDCIRVCIAR
jgi:hypothetical protein